METLKGRPQLSVDERMEGVGVSDMSYEKHFLEHFHKACFNLVHEKEIYILSAFSTTSADLFHKIGKKNT